MAIKIRKTRHRDRIGAGITIDIYVGKQFDPDKSILARWQITQLDLHRILLFRGHDGGVSSCHSVLIHFLGFFPVLNPRLNSSSIDLGRKLVDYNSVA